MGAPTFVLIGDADWAAGFGVPVVRVAAPEDAAAAFAHGLPVLHRPLPVAVCPGRPDPAAAPAVAASIREAVALTLAGRCGAVATLPIAKKVMQDGGFGFPGHTEFLGALTGAARPVMMLAGPSLRVVPVTIHVALQAVPGLLSSDLIVQTAHIAAAGLHRFFGIAAPRLAVSGLNPHAGEDGAMGREEIEIIAPAVARLRAEGLEAVGPLPADTMFHAAARERYDAALCMYHDQALIPLKALDFDRAVNVTLGLPIARVSPDHGTAFDIAGRGIADPTSLIEALRLGARMAAAPA